MHKGFCLCGQVSFEVKGTLGVGEMCHCTQCRKWTGRALASAEVKRGNLTIKRIVEVLNGLNHRIR